MRITLTWFSIAHQQGLRHRSPDNGKARQAAARPRSPLVLLPCSKRHDAAVLVRTLEVALIGRNEHRLVILERNGMIKGVEDMLPGLDRDAAGTTQHRGLVAGGNFHGPKHQGILDHTIGAQACQDGNDFREPMKRLQYGNLTASDGAHQRGGAVRFPPTLWIRQQPLEDHAGVEYDRHARPASRAARIRSLLAAPRRTRALLSCRNSCSRRSLSSESRTARRISSAISALLF